MMLPCVYPIAVQDKVVVGTAQISAQRPHSNTKNKKNTHTSDAAFGHDGARRVVDAGVYHPAVVPGLVQRNLEHGRPTR